MPWRISSPLDRVVVKLPTDPVTPVTISSKWTLIRSLQSTRLIMASTRGLTRPPRQVVWSFRALPPRWSLRSTRCTW